MKRMLTLEDLNRPALRGATVLVRVDFNVPIADGEVTDDTRLVEALPTLEFLRDTGAKLLLASHRGRPKGEVDPALSLAPVVPTLEKLLGREVTFVEDCVGEAVADAAEALEPGGVCLLENLRFHAGEKANDPEFAARLAAPADVFVNDAFGTAHRAHASVVGVAERLERKAAGRLLAREVEALGHLLGEPDRPSGALLGGAKISGKIDTLVNLLPRLDCLMVGGGMANTFLAARGLDLQRSLVEDDRIDTAREILERSAERGTRVLLPSDLVVTDDFSDPKEEPRTVPAGEVPEGWLAMDVGPDTRRAFRDAIGGLGTLFWNGPLGVFEKPPFDAGTEAVAQALPDCPGFTVLGGGETVAAARRAGVTEEVGHVSTGGGASLDLLAGKVLPGVAALEVNE